MDLKQLFADDDAVSPVIGVILMVAITVILAAVIGTFVLGLGGQVSSSAPSANVGFSFENTTVATISHNGGDPLDANTLSVKVGGTTAWNSSGFQNNFGGAESSPWSGTLTAGDSLTIHDSGGTDHDGQSVKVIWSSSSGGDTAIIGSQTWSA